MNPNQLALQISLAGGTQALITGASGGLSTDNNALVTNVKKITQLVEFQLDTGPAPRQILGFNPLTPCNDAECRITPQLTCYFNPVFSNLSLNKSTYENDLSPFWLDTANCTKGTTFQFVIQKLYNDFWTPGSPNNTNWVSMATVIDNTYGIYNKLGSIAAHPTYMGFTVNWQRITDPWGEGVYRIMVQACISTFNPNVLTICNLPTLARVSNVMEGPNFVSTYNGFLYVGLIDFSIGASFSNLNSYADNDLAYLNLICSGINATPSCGVSASLNGSNCIVFLPIGEGAKPAIGHGNPLLLFSKTNQWSPWVVGMQGTKATNASQYTTLGTIPAINSGTTSVACACSMVSEPYVVRIWDCIKADATVKFEVNMLNSVGDPATNTFFDVTGMNFYDSIRFRGKIHKEKYSYDETMLEYGEGTVEQFGFMQRIHDKVITEWELEGFDLPQYIHLRFGTWGLTAANVYVSDYNLLNPNYDIVKMPVVKNGNYEPEYLEDGRFDMENQYRARLGSVKVKLKQGIQSVVISNYFS